VVQRPLGDNDPTLRPVLPALTVASLDTWIAMHEDLRTLPRVRTVFDHLARAFRRLGGRAAE
jgi:hypothetical protein